MIPLLLHYKTTKVVFIETAARSPKRQAVLVILLDFAACGNRKALRLRAKGVYSCK